MILFLGLSPISCADRLHSARQENGLYITASRDDIFSQTQLAFVALPSLLIITVGSAGMQLHLPALLESTNYRSILAPLTTFKGKFTDMLLRVTNLCWSNESIHLVEEVG